MLSLALYELLLGAVALERSAELVVSKQHERWAKTHGGIESGRGHYPAMVALHTALIAGSALEPLLLRRRFRPGLGFAMLGLALGAQAVRWWCIGTLGKRWNTRVITIPGQPRIRRGPYRVLSHPNYVAVVVEGIALPLVHSAWLTAAVFTLLDAPLLGLRIRCENAALARAERART